MVAVVDDSTARAFAEAGFELFAGRRSTPGPTSETSLATAYVCRDFVCRLPVTDVASLDRELAQA